MSGKKMTFEQQLGRLEEIVAALEKGDVPLADSLALFAEGKPEELPFEEAEV